MKIVGIGTVQIGKTIFDAMIRSGYSVDTIFTLPSELSATTSGFVDFDYFYHRYGVHIVKTPDINSEENIRLITSIAPDLVVVCGWQRLVCRKILEVPPLGAIGFHSSLLPKYRGRAPVNWAILLGEKVTGITMFYLTPEADAGDIIAQSSLEILFNDDCRTVYEKAADSGAELLCKYLPMIEKGTAPRIHNDARSYPCYPKRTPDDGLIDFSRSALDIYNFVRALTKPYPGAFYYDENGKKIMVWKVEIVFDESRLQPGDMVLSTRDNKIRVLDWEYAAHY